MKVWRIAAETRTYRAIDLSGAGAAKSGGRWNDVGQPCVYAATTIAIAVLETAAHVETKAFPLNKFVIEIDVPDSVWAGREVVDLAALPPTWAAIPAGLGSVAFGSTWLNSLRSPILLVPSVIVPEELAVLINPRHAANGAISARATRPFEYNRLFRTQGRRT